MNLFPKKYKDKALQPQNRLEVLDEGITPYTPQKSRQHKPAHNTLRKSPTNLNGSSTTPEPGGTGTTPTRQVFLTTVTKDHPMKRTRRDVTQSRKNQQKNLNHRPTELDPVDECLHNTTSFNQLLKTSLKATLEARKSLSIRVVTKMRQCNTPLDLETYNLLLHLLQDTTDSFLIYSQLQQDEGLQPDIQTFRLLLRACERCGTFPKAFELVNEMKEEYGILPDTTMYNTLLSFCVLKRDEALASELFEEMKERSVKPNVHTYNCLMNVFAESPAELLAQMFEDMLRQAIAPNLRTYNALMRSCQRTGDYDRAFKLFEELKAEGLCPDVVTYNVLIDMCKERLDYVQGKRQVSVNRRNREQQESGMRAIAVLSLSLFNEMDEREIRPNTFTYNALMGVLARCADVRIFTVFRAMKEDAKEEADDRNKLQEHLDSGDLQDNEGALLLAGLGDMQNGALIDDKSGAALRGHYQRLLIGDDAEGRQSAFGVKPDIQTYHTLLVAAERMRKAEHAYDIFNEMKGAGIQPDAKTYMKMMDVCVLRNETGRALELFREATASMAAPDVDLYNSFLNVLAEAGDAVIFDAFDELGNDSKNMTIKPNQQTYNTLIKACTKLRRETDPGPDDPLPTDETGMHEREVLLSSRAAERAEKALSIYEEMCRPSAPVKPDTETYDILMDVCYIAKDPAKARDLLEQMTGRGIPPSITTYNKMLNTFVIADDPSITDVFNVLKTGNDPTPNLETYIILLSFYAERVDPAILVLFDEMKKVGLDPDNRVYNIMLNYCAKLQDKRRSLKFFEELKLRELTADIDTYNALMAVFAETGDELIYKVFEEMIENNINPDKTTFSTLIKQKRGLDCLRKAGEKGLLDTQKEDLKE